jgi:hypothetical protein
VIFAAVTLAGGWWVFSIFLVGPFFALVYGYYTRRGSAINLRPWRPRGSSGEADAARRSGSRTTP